MIIRPDQYRYSRSVLRIRDIFRQLLHTRSRFRIHSPKFFVGFQPAGIYASHRIRIGALHAPEQVDCARPKGRYQHSPIHQRRQRRLEVLRQPGHMRCPLPELIPGIFSRRSVPSRCTNCRETTSLTHYYLSSVVRNRLDFREMGTY